MGRFANRELELSSVHLLHRDHRGHGAIGRNGHGQVRPSAVSDFGDFSALDRGELCHFGYIFIHGCKGIRFAGKHGIRHQFGNRVFVGYRVYGSHSDKITIFQRPLGTSRPGNHHVDYGLNGFGISVTAILQPFRISLYIFITPPIPLLFH